ncbi:MAG: acyl carrier protein [Pyrinomonadaceae bacterium]|nr:acyl carrier protein [Pyrinomonadaceae bacterium]
MNSTQEISAWLRKKIAGEMKCEPNEVKTDVEFGSLGLDSLLSVSLADQLGGKLGVELDPTIFWEFPTIELLTNWLVTKKLRK